MAEYSPPMPKPVMMRPTANQMYVQLLSALSPAELARLGGSAAQREVVADTLLEALLRLGDTLTARRVLEDGLEGRGPVRDITVPVRRAGRGGWHRRISEERG